MILEAVFLAVLNHMVNCFSQLSVTTARKPEMSLIVSKLVLFNEIT